MGRLGSLTAQTAAARLGGTRPPALKALVVAAVAGVAAGALTYKALRSAPAD